MKKKFILIAIILLSIIIKLCFFKFESLDYTIFLQKWIKIMSNNGGIFSLKNTFTDYNYPYLIFLSILSYIPIKPIYFIKLLSLIFDLLIAILGYKFVYKYSSNKEKSSIICFLLILLNPIIFLNSCLWGQCDSIYSFFVLLSIYYLCDKKINKSFIALGIAFSLKLQTIFIFPLFIIMLFCSKKIKLYHFLIIPIINFIMCIPAYLVGGSILYTYKIYFFQISEYPNITYAITNLYNFIPNSFVFKLFGILLTFIIFCLLLTYYYRKRDNINSYSIINLSLLSLFVCILFLPSMHERYSYLIDIFTIIWSIINAKKYYIPIITNICSMILYAKFLFSIKIYIIFIQFLTILYLFAFYACLKTIIVEINTKKSVKLKGNKL